MLIAVSLLLAAGQAATASAAPAPEKKICRRVENTGSIMGTRTCHTKTEWTKIDGANQQSMDNYHDRSVTRSGIDGGR